MYCVFIGYRYTIRVIEARVFIILRERCVGRIVGRFGSEGVDVPCEAAYTVSDAALIAKGGYACSWDEGTSTWI
jgi:hypothetical protein